MPDHKNELIPTRASLLNRLKDWQDQSGWQEFFDTYWKLIYGVARKTGLTDVEAQDVVQEVMASVAKHMPTFEYNPSGSFKAWLLKMTRWRIISQLRARGLVLADFAKPTDSASTDPVARIVDPASLDLDRFWEAEWEQNLFDAALRKIKQRVDPKKYQIFDFYVNKEWPPEKVARKFGVSVDQVYLAKHRVAEMIKEEVKRLEQKTT